jgi:sulfopyruvate decarboxylase beta subunit
LDVSNEIVAILNHEGVDFFTTYPCAKFQRLYKLIHDQFLCVGLAKEEEGVGICAGASLAGKKPAMLIQSTGFGNMFNALSSLSVTYQIPLLILASWRGIHDEIIPAQIPLGKSLPKLFQALDYQYYIVKEHADLDRISTAAHKAFNKNSVQIILLHPLLWENDEPPIWSEEQSPPNPQMNVYSKLPPLSPGLLTRYEILKLLLPFLQNTLTICNIGFPSRELYQLNHKSTNFYMLGSLGLASSIGLGVAMGSSKSVAVIDGDGSLLSNLGTLSTIACVAPSNLTIIVIDNGVHGSTGNQPTAAASCVDLAQTAQAVGFKHVFRGTNSKQLKAIFAALSSGPNFIHIPARPGNAQVPTIPLSPKEIKKHFMIAIRS